MRHGIFLLVLMAMAACTGAPEQPISPLSAATGDACGASAHTHLAGQDAGVLERLYILGQVRILRPGGLVTADLRPERLNFELDDENRITRVFCA